MKCIFTECWVMHIFFKWFAVVYYIVFILKHMLESHSFIVSYIICYRLDTNEISTCWMVTHPAEIGAGQQWQNRNHLNA